MIEKVCSTQPTEQNAPRIQHDPSQQLVSIPPSRKGGRYRVRVGNKLFQGDDTRHLIKLAVQARRSQLRTPREASLSAH